VVEMAELVVKVPEAVKQGVEKHREIDWSEVIGKAIKSELEELAKRQLVLTALNKILGGSKLTEDDALKLGDELKERVWRRYQEEGW